MNSIKCIHLLFLVACCVPFVYAEQESATQHIDAVYKELIKELRCPKCTNQSLADSDSIISEDLKMVVRSQLQQGKSVEEVKQFLVARYGHFILYNPPVQQNTALLWYGPLIAFVFGALFFIWLYFKYRTPRNNQPNSSQPNKKGGTA